MDSYTLYIDLLMIFMKSCDCHVMLYLRIAKKMNNTPRNKNDTLLQTLLNALKRNK